MGAKTRITVARASREDGPTAAVTVRVTVAVGTGALERSAGARKGAGAGTDTRVESGTGASVASGRSADVAMVETVYVSADTSASGRRAMRARGRGWDGRRGFPKVPLRRTTTG
jgi:hypothetical protein